MNEFDRKKESTKNSLKLSERKMKDEKAESDRFANEIFRKYRREFRQAFGADVSVDTDNSGSFSSIGDITIRGRKISYRHYGLSDDWLEDIENEERLLSYLGEKAAKREFLEEKARDKLVKESISFPFWIIAFTVLFVFVYIVL